VVAGQPTERRCECMHSWLVFYIFILSTLETMLPHADPGGGLCTKTFPRPAHSYYIIYMYVYIYNEIQRAELRLERGPVKNCTKNFKLVADAVFSFQLVVIFLIDCFLIRSMHSRY
jgi:hypothetical protein